MNIESLCNQLCEKMAEKLPCMSHFKVLYIIRIQYRNIFQSNNNNSFAQFDLSRNVPARRNHSHSTKETWHYPVAEH